MLSSVSVLKSHNSYDFMKKSLKRGQSSMDVEFAPGVNIIVGNNGCGKTTFFNILKARLVKGESMKDIEFTIQEDFDLKKIKPCYFFTMNEMGAREQMRNTVPNGRNMDKFAYHLECAELSSGQQVEEVIENIDALKGNASLICIDEPEISLDSTNMIKLIKSLKAIAKEGVQVVVISHHPMLALNKEFNVFSLDKTSKYVDEMRKSIAKLI